MATGHRTLIVVLISLLVLVLIVVLATPMFLNADSFRTRIQSSMSTSLGRQVSLGKLNLSVLSGGLVAEDSSVANDPAFSNQPFLQTGPVKINVELLPLLFSHEIHITGFTLDSPHIVLLRAPDGTWDYSSIGKAHKAITSGSGGVSVPNLTIGHLSITNGKLTVGNVASPGGPITGTRTYDQLTLDAKDFSFEKAFPFTASARLPGDGTVSLKGTAGPIDQHDASLTPFTAQLGIKHLDPVAAGFLDTTAGITGLIDAIDVQATWNGRQLHVANLLVDTPKLTLVRTNKPTTAEQPPTPNSNNMLSTLSADRLQIKNGVITVTTPGQSTPAVYQQLNAEITNFSPTTASPFKLSAQIPGGGSVTADGSAGPLNQLTPAATPLNVHATLTHVDLASSGIVAPDAGISGLANIDIKAISDGKNLNANAAANVQGLRVARNGSPSPKPVNLQLTVAQNMQALTGQIQKAVVTIGSAVINIAGTYQTSGPTTAINLKVTGDGVSIDELEAFLPSVGVHLPTGSRLQGGTLTTSLNVTGSTANPIISGPLQLNNTNLAGFDLGSKLSAVTALTGAKTGSVTQIKSLSTNIRVANGDVRTDNLALNVPALGTATGAGTVSAAGALNYQLVLKPTGLLGGGSGGASAGVGGIAGQLMGMIPGGAAGSIASAALKNGIPVAIGGTTANPTFTPNLGGMLGSGASATNGSKAAPAKKPNTTDSLTNALGGLLKQH
jgi:AsmA protein